jgi:hypothetical protein
MTSPLLARYLPGVRAQFMLRSYTPKPCWTGRPNLNITLPISIRYRSLSTDTLREETWVLSSGREETERRAIAVADALGLPYVVKRVKTRPSK